MAQALTRSFWNKSELIFMRTRKDNVYTHANIIFVNSLAANSPHIHSTMMITILTYQCMYFVKISRVVIKWPLNGRSTLRDSF